MNEICVSFLNHSLGPKFKLESIYIFIFVLLPSSCLDVKTNGLMINLPLHSQSTELCPFDSGPFALLISQKYLLNILTTVISVIKTYKLSPT